MLTVRYRRDHPLALRAVTMEAPPGCLYAVLGPNGSGKSTLMRAFLGSVEPESGSARLDGRPVQAWSRRELALAVGAVAQAESIAFPLSVRELVGMGRYPHLGPFRPEGEADRRAIHDALARCEVGDLADRDVGTLSGGELQRVRVARALAQEPRALLLDEPTASLDIRHAMQILHLLRASADRGMAVLLITHHLNLAARFADRILLLNHGAVAAEGAVAAVLREDILEEVYEWKLKVDPDPSTGRPRVTPLS